MRTRLRLLPTSRPCLRPSFAPKNRPERRSGRTVAARGLGARRRLYYAVAAVEVAEAAISMTYTVVAAVEVAGLAMKRQRTFT